MAAYTDNLNLIKPAQGENYNVDVANTNNEIIDNAIGNKQDKIPGKGMSSNDFTNEYKRKLDAVKKIYTFKGSVSTYNDLSSITEKEVGDVWNILDTGDNYSWNGTEWIEIGIDTDFSDIETEINNIDNEIELLETKMNPTDWTNVTLGSALSGGTIRYAKLGNLVIVTIRNLTTANVLTGGTILAQGLPTSVVGENFLMSNYAATNNDLNCLIGMSTAGVLSIIGDTMYAGNAQYFAQFMYITTE